MTNIHRTGRATGAGSAAFAFFVLIALAGCAPGDGDGRISVRTLEVSATGAEGVAFQGGAVDSTWTTPDNAGQLTRSLVLDPGDPSGTPNRLVDLAMGALVTGFGFHAPADPPGDPQVTENQATGLIEINLQQGIAFRATVAIDYRRDEDLAWRGSGAFDDRMVWIDGTVTPADTVRIVLEGEYQEVRAAGGRQTTLSGRGTLYVASAGEYQIEVTERVETTGTSTAHVARRLGDALEGIAPR